MQLVAPCTGGYPGVILGPETQPSGVTAREISVQRERRGRAERCEHGGQPLLAHCRCCSPGDAVWLLQPDHLPNRPVRICT